MLGVVIDTNVLVSAILSPGGNPARVLASIFDGKIQLYYSGEIMAEYQEVLFRNKFGFEEGRVSLILKTLEEFGRLKTLKASTVLLPDETDRVFYDAAKVADAFLVTGNLRHYPEEEFIITPRELMEKMVSKL
ncbi:MAG: putative toxin-antitoxin system toxin component, PIN family [Synergistaceae bacterium]|jgi:putative PIN family toxin of toxin-antitoxin system|nr:putative toxin-antitoxin system toxin component, PIN family [Synergistaceae bacterium]